MNNNCLNQVLEKIEARQSLLADWFEMKWRCLTPPLYLSCDIRHSGWKLGVIDANLFPAGFNNLCRAYRAQTQEAFQQYLHSHFPRVRKILLLIEEHTRNKYYLENVLALRDLLGTEALEILIAYPGITLSEASLDISLDLKRLTLHRLGRRGSHVEVGDFVPDLIISNNDFSGGIPEILQNIAQPLIPSATLGWHTRHKYDHFAILNDLVDEVALLLEVDPWLLHPLTSPVGDINLTDTEDLDRLAKAVDEMLVTLREKYLRYQIQEEPYVYLKSSSGTYGMGIIHVSSGEEIRLLNRRRRNKLSSSKGGVRPRQDFIIQEGIPTCDKYSDHPIEPVLYAVGKKVIGGFFRVHESKDERESLNAPGMSFSCLCLHKLDEPHEEFFLQCEEKAVMVKLARFLTELACLSAALEAKR